MTAAANTVGPSRPTLLNLPPSMRILSWNCRGAGRPEFLTAARDLIHRTTPEIFIVLDTRMHEERAHPLIQRLPFTDCIVLSALGFAGGIWVLWNAAVTTVRQMRLGPRTTHLEVEHKTGEDPFILSAVYNHPQPNLQHQVWDELNSISDLINNHKWLLIGDFNCILHPHEKIGGNFYPTRILRFSECMNYCNLLDLGYIGHKFTWTNRQFGKSFICERLDRALANVYWCNAFPKPLLLTLVLAFQTIHPFYLTLAQTRLIELYYTNLLDMRLVGLFMRISFILWLMLGNLKCLICWILDLGLVILILLLRLLDGKNIVLVT
ncbi:UNVERIFIED_CONTAM: hypothetical protein Sradi_0776800 [Sesamum radiatum]|uniref:Endonuclease/exonuclease/phosphatase domain-containing protein n=1 Tax=Sesamum radiatum TaxID=300843 RepID=A0AAW2VQL1_SESRA